MEMSKTEQKRLLTKFKKYLKKAGLGNRMRLDDTADFDYVELQIAKKDGDYNDSYIVVFNRDGLENRFCYNDN